MPDDPFYKTAVWRRLREQVLIRDRRTCTVKGCGRPGVVVDHVRPRSAGGPDVISNLRTLCRRHDNQAHREKPAGGGARVERFTVPGCDDGGLPTDPNHPWNRPPNPRGRGGQKV